MNIGLGQIFFALPLLTLTIGTRPVLAETRATADYTITTDALDSGASAYSASYAQRGALGALAGASAATLPDSTTRYLSHGFVAQLDAPLFAATDVGISMVASSLTVSKNGTFSYSLFVTNRGPENAAGAVAMVTLPPNVNFVSATASQGTCTHSGSLVNCQLGELPVGGQASVTIVVNATGEGPALASAALVTEAFDTDASDNSASAQSSVMSAVLWAGGNGDWSNPNNWFPAGVPGPDASAVITNGTVNVTSDTTVGGLTLTNATLRGPATLTVAGTALWSSGLFIGPGKLDIAQGATLTLASASNLQLQDGYILDNSGTIALTGPGWLNCDRGATIENRSNAVFEIQSDVGIYRVGFVEFVFNNHPGAVLRKSGGTGVSSINFGTTLQNDGLVEIRTGTLEFAWTLVNSGTINAAPGATASYVNGQTFNPGSILNGAGQHRVTAGNSTFTGQIAASNLELADGQVRGTFTNTGNILWTGGVILGGGALTIPVGSTLTVSSTNNLQLQDGYTLDNSGTITLTGPGWLTCDRGANIHNRSGGLFDAQQDTGIFRQGFEWFAFNNHAGAVFRKSGGTGTGGLGGGAYIVNDGIIDVRTGTFAIAGDYSPSPSSVLNLYLGGPTPGTQFSRLQVGGAITLTGTLNVALTNGFVPAPANSFQIVSGSARTGTFAVINTGAPGNGQAFEPVYQPDSLVLNLRNPRATFATKLVLDNDGFHMRISGVPNATYFIQAATRLGPAADWATLGTNVFASGQIDFLDPDATLFSQRFYRAVLAP